MSLPPLASEPFDRALATLMRGADFLATGPRRFVDGPYRARVIANGLRELDRFLNLLIDEATLRQGGVAYPGRHNTANKLNGWHGRTGAPGDDARLRALGRSRDCLFHCGGHVGRGDRRGHPWLTAGWPEIPGSASPLRCFAVGADLAIDRDDLTDIASFYRRLGMAIERAGIVTESCPSHIAAATVAN